MPFSFTAPFLSKEDEEAEIKALTEEEKKEVHDDLYGIVVELDETEALIVNALNLLREAIDSIAPERKQDYLKALEVVPELVQSETDPVVFLRCAQFDAWTAADRLVSYWRLRVSFFGPSRAFEPMTLRGAMAEDVENLEMGLLQLLPNDTTGRAVLFFDRVRCTKNVMGRDEAMRCMFYLVHTLLKDESAQKHGYIYVMNCKGYDLYKHSDRIFMKMNLALLLEFPISWKSTHYCTGPAQSVLRVVLPVLKQLAGKRYRLRLVTHAGSDGQVVGSFKEYGVEAKSLSIKVGGSYRMEDFQQWMEQRRQLEARGDLVVATMG